MALNWIRTKESLPEHNQIVVLISTTNNICIGMYKYFEEKFCEDTYEAYKSCFGYELPRKRRFFLILDMEDFNLSYYMRDDIDWYRNYLTLNDLEVNYWIPLYEVVPLGSHILL